MTVYVVQELRRFVCPKCKHAWITRLSDGSYECESCQEIFERADTVPKYDLTPAAAYGRLVILIKRNKIGIAAQPIIDSLRHDLRNFSDDDHLLAVGDPVAIGLAIAVAADMNRGRVKVLKWDRQTSQYIEVEANLRPRREVLSDD